MKNTTFLYLLPLAAALSVTSCVDPVALDKALTYDPGSYSPGNSYSNVDHNAYNRGYDDGRVDANRGRPNNYANHSGDFNGASLNQFRHGYQVGYRNYMPHYASQYEANNYDSTYSNRDYQARNNHTKGPIRASVGQGQITITKGGKQLSTIQTASPNIEQHHFINDKSQIVVKSRGNHGPATVQLFDTRTGTLKGKVLAYAIQHGQPAWARGMQD